MVAAKGLTLTGFADEISSDLDVQLECLESESIRYLEFRGVWGKNVLKLNDEELERVKVELARRGFGVSSIGSPIGKVKITDPFEPHLQDFERAIFTAKYLNTNYIRVFSFFIPQQEDPSLYRDEVITRMKALAKRAEEAEIILLHENEKDIYGDVAERCLEILEQVDSPALRCAFDPANFVQCGVKPFQDAYPKLKKHIDYLHIKDAQAGSGKVVPPGEGDGEVAELLATLKAEGYSGYMSLEPHLKAAEAFQGFSGPDLFKVATKALKNLLADIEWQWK